MKNVFLAVLVLLSAILHAQDGTFHIGKLMVARIGIQGGTCFVLNTTQKEFSEIFNPLPGYEVGGYAGVDFLKFLGVRLEANYSMQRWDYNQVTDYTDPTNPAIYGDERINMRNTEKWMRFPLMLSIIPNPRIRFNVGPEMNILRSSVGTGRIVYENGTIPETIDNEVEVDYLQTLGDSYKKAFGGNAGVNVLFGDHFAAEIRANYTLNDLIYDYYLNEDNNKKIDQFTGRILLRYEF
jgi:hypothetical protein